MSFSGKNCKMLLLFCTRHTTFVSGTVQIPFGWNEILNFKKELTEM